MQTELQNIVKWQNVKSNNLSFIYNEDENKKQLELSLAQKDLKMFLKLPL